MRRECPAMPDGSARQWVPRIRRLPAWWRFVARALKYALVGMTVALMLAAAGALVGLMALGLAAGILVAATLAWRGRARWTHASAARHRTRHVPSVAMS